MGSWGASFQLGTTSIKAQGLDHLTLCELCEAQYIGDTVCGGGVGGGEGGREGANGRDIEGGRQGKGLELHPGRLTYLACEGVWILS